MSARIVLRCSNNVVDVFHGEEGWLDWTRFVKVNREYLKFLRGMQISPADFNEVKRLLDMK